MFKVGDEVEVMSGKSSSSRENHGKIGKILKFLNNDRSIVGSKEIDNGGGLWIEELKLISNNKKNNMNIKEKFVLAFLGEPEKTFRKTDITNGDGFLTTEGTAVFLAWLLKENGEKFKTDVADDLLADLEAKE